MKKFDPSLPVVFIHMEKNGGTTVSHVLDQMCPPGRAFREHADRHKLEDGTFDKKDYDIYNGHLFFPKIVDTDSHKPPKTISFLKIWNRIFFLFVFLKCPMQS